MRKLAAFLLLLFTFNSVQAGDETEKIKSVVHYWNHLHNINLPKNFKLIYGKQVLFYGRNFSGQKCYEKKKKFLTPDSQQEIISPVKLKFYSSGTIKCLFRKKVTAKGIVKEHDCYLLVRKDGDGYVVTGESDLETDKNLGVRLNLGEEIIPKARAINNYILFGVAGLTVAFIIILISKKKKNKNIPIPAKDVLPELSDTYVTTKQPAVVELQSAVKEAIKESFKEIQLEAPPEKKGFDFEKYIVERFNKNYFTLIQWQSDKAHAGHYARYSLLPDIVFKYEDTRNYLKFAIECKWRAEFFNGKIELKKEQLDTYKQFGNNEKIKVFLVLGIGGVPSAPDHVYVIPINNLRSQYLTQYQLKEYYRHKKGDFFLNTYNMILE